MSSSQQSIFFWMQIGLWENVDDMLTTKNGYNQENLNQQNGENGDTLLIQAARAGKDSTVELLLQAGVEIDATNKLRETALYVAAHHGKVTVVQRLLSKGANIDAKNNFGFTPLLTSARFGHSEIVGLLCQKRANMMNHEGANALYLAVQNGHVTVVEVLLNNGANIEALKDGKSMLILAAYTGNLDIVKLLCVKGAKLDAKDNENLSALGWAEKKKHVEVVKYLKTYSAKSAAAQPAGSSGWYPGKYFRKLVSGGFKNDVNFHDIYKEDKDDEFKAPDNIHGLLRSSKKAFIALENGDWKKVREEVCSNGSYLSGLELNKRHGEKEDTLLIKAARLGREELVDLILTAGAAIEAENKGGATALSIAAQEGHLAAVEVLVNKKAEIETKDKVGFTPLCTSSQNGHFNVIGFLCQRRANVDATTTDGSTPLYLAAQNSHVKAVEMLLEGGANIEKRFKSGHTPLLAATYLGHDELIALLCMKGANVEAQTKDGATALFLAAQKGHVHAIKILAYWKAAIETKNKNGTTPLIAAAEQGHLEAVQILCKLGANVDAQDKRLTWTNITGHKVNALYWAEQGNHWKVAHFLSAWQQKKVVVPIPANPQPQKSVVELYPELSDLLYSIINETAMPSAPVFKQRVIVSRCIDRFVANGFTDIQSVENACARINSDDLALHTANVPADVVAIIYKTIHSMRKQQVEPATPQIIPGSNGLPQSSVRLVIALDNLTVGSGNSYILNGVFTGGFYRCVNQAVKVKAVEKSKQYLLLRELEALHKLVVQLNCKRFVKPLHDSLIPCTKFAEISLIPANADKIVGDGVAMVMEKGIITLQDYIVNYRRQLSFGELLEIIWALVEMVKEAHDNQLVLMDIKGANVMKFEADLGYSTWKGIDLGSCLPVGTPLSGDNGSSSTIMTTVHFMAPELLSSCCGQQQHADLTAMFSMDIWSLGILIFDVLIDQQQQSFWNLLEIHCDDGIKEEIKSGNFTQEKVDKIIEKYFPEPSYRTFLQRMLSIDPTKRSRVDELHHAALMKGGPSTPHNTILN